ncbi:uncharacterized protein EI90DRAFT_3094106 [Cantharellus anzutake]|uniref:uncharacterized protein n=1 Tax=Cantharellus anzutake TaxID=1750568 RepID=UPI0019059E98|nr:uncharacterized protein EI90DRAFT_3094106 [Cantharellus anzutake]KAF8312294.1 hypothetical protein EI90DRAFT_3094106 [Cantharellus anzutake]
MDDDGNDVGNSVEWNTTVFVGGLSSAVTEEELLSCFGVFGEIHYVSSILDAWPHRLVTNCNMTNRSRFLQGRHAALFSMYARRMLLRRSRTCKVFSSVEDRFG